MAGSADTCCQYSSFLLELRREVRRLQLHKTTQRTGTYEALQQLFKSPVYDAIGITWGALGIANSETHTFEMPTEEAVSTADSHVLLPYLGEARQYDPLVRFLFGQRRASQRLDGKSGLDATDEEGRRRQSGLEDWREFGPEFYLHLPPATNMRSGLPSHRLETRFREELGCHYCGRGEMAFFLIGWRIIMRFLSEYGAAPPFMAGEISLSESGQKPFNRVWGWGPDGTVCGGADQDWLAFWWHEEMLTSYEAYLPEMQLLRTINGLEGEMPDLWHSLVSEFDASVENDAYMKDWVALSLISAEDTFYSLTENGLALVQYAKACRDSEPSLRRAFVQALSFVSAEKRHNRDQRKFLREALDAASPTERYTREQLGMIDLSLQVVIYLVLSHSAGHREETDTRAHVLLHRLHRLARFPIIPYFYLWAVEKKPTTHLVFPIWLTTRFPAEVSIPPSEPTPDGRGLMKTPCVGIALLGVKPIDGIDWTVSSTRSAGTDTQEEPTPAELAAYESVQRMMLVCEEIGKPLIDEQLYGVVVEERLRQDSEERLRGSQEHEMKHVLTALGRHWMLAPNEATKAHMNEDDPSVAAIGDWRLVPFPDLITGTSQLLRLWILNSQLMNWLDGEKPETLEELVNLCFQRQKVIFKPLIVRSYGERLGYHLEEVRTRLDLVDGLWRDGSTKLDPQISGFPDFSPAAANRWLNFVRALSMIFGNVVRHADPRQPIRVDCEADSSAKPPRLVLSVRNSVLEKTDDDRIAAYKEVWPDLDDVWWYITVLKKMAEIGGTYGSGAELTKTFVEKKLSTKADCARYTSHRDRDDQFWITTISFVEAVLREESEDGTA